MASILYTCAPPLHPPKLSSNSTLNSSIRPFKLPTSPTTNHFSLRFISFNNGGANHKNNQNQTHTNDSNNNNNLPVEKLASDPFLIKLAIGLAFAVAFTFLSILVKTPISPADHSSHGQSFAIQFLPDTAPPVIGFSFHAFGYRVLLPQYAPGWVYFWLLMAAGCGLFISEEALNIWVGISLSRLLLLDGTWQSFCSSFATHIPYIASTVMWVYWGVCISDMIPFYLGKVFSQASASDEVYSKFGIGSEKVEKITQAVRKYGNLIGFVERFSIGMRNPTAFVAGALGISADRFFAGVCLGGLITLPVQLAIGVMLRERPMVAIATVATAVGIWTLFPYALAACTALFLFLRNKMSS